MEKLVISWIKYSNMGGSLYSNGHLIPCLFLKFLGTFHIQVNHGGQYITVPHLPEAIQVNIGGVMQRWTGDQYIAPVCNNVTMYRCTSLQHVMIVASSVRKNQLS